MAVLRLSDITKDTALKIIALQKKDDKVNKDFEVDVDNLLRNVIEKYANEQVKAERHYLLAKFTHTIANVTKDKFDMFNQMMTEIGYQITRVY